MASNSTTGENESLQAGILQPWQMHPYGANAIRLSLADWAITAVVVGAALFAIPRWSERRESVELTGDERIPYALSEDYWFYNRHLAHVCSDSNVVVLGDSVIWGEYVAPNETLSHFLSEQSETSHFVNGGLNGTHPLALWGLVQYYTSPLTHRQVILHCNLLWMSSPERDLRLNKELAFNHPQLVPQFMPWIPSYRAALADRMGVVVDRVVPFRGWVKHTRIKYFDGQDPPSWTLEHPHDNPLARVLTASNPPDEAPRHPSVPWYERGIEPQDFPWVELKDSLQWRAFRETVVLLRNRGNEVFVLLGPLNQHLLTAESRQRFNTISQQIRQWLGDNKIPHLEPAVLPSEDYADASHPLAKGYKQLAREIGASREFQDWVSARHGPRQNLTTQKGE